MISTSIERRWTSYHPEWGDDPLHRELDSQVKAIDSLTEYADRLESELKALAAVVFDGNRSPDDRLTACVTLMTANGWQPNKGE